MTLHAKTFRHLMPTPAQIEALNNVSGAIEVCADTLQAVVPEGPDRTYMLRVLREAGMWANIAITRHPDGTPRT